MHQLLIRLYKWLLDLPSYMHQLLIRLYHWLTDRPSYMLLTASEERLAGAAPERFAHAWIGLMGLSLAWGVAMASLYAGSWGVFSDVTRIHLMPVALVVLATVVWMYRRAVADLASMVTGTRGEGAAPAGAGVTILLALAMLGLDGGKPDYSDSLHWMLHWIPSTMFRPLILAPLWGAWAMLITVQFCRPTERTEPAIAALTRGCGPLTAALCMLAPAAATVWSFRLFDYAAIIPVATVVAAIAGGWVFCRLQGAPTRRGLLATNMLTQLVLILAYLAIIR